MPRILKISACLALLVMVIGGVQAFDRVVLMEPFTSAT
jgi:hypothetical protein